MHFRRITENTVKTIASPVFVVFGQLEGTSLAARFSYTSQSCDTLDVGVTPDVPTRHRDLSVPYKRHGQRCIYNLPYSNCISRQGRTTSLITVLSERPTSRQELSQELSCDLSVSTDPNLDR